MNNFKLKPKKKLRTNKNIIAYILSYILLNDIVADVIHEKKKKTVYKSVYLRSKHCSVINLIKSNHPKLFLQYYSYNHNFQNIKINLNDMSVAGIIKSVFHIFRVHAVTNGSNLMV